MIDLQHKIAGNCSNQKRPNTAKNKMAKPAKTTPASTKPVKLKPATSTPPPAIPPSAPVQPAHTGNSGGNGWFGPLVAIILLAGIVGGGVVGLHYWLSNREPAYTKHNAPPTADLVTVCKYNTGKKDSTGEEIIIEIGIVNRIAKDESGHTIMREDGKPKTQAVVSENPPAVEITGDWAKAKWIVVSNDRSKLGFQLKRPVPGQEGKFYYPKTFWALSRG